ncbi:MAG: hypothetical protein Q7K57_38890 [Burkholderiaceae bacterium]|nr:hypothetical protein [Burkholderiaceae bacterium]
MNKYTKQGTLQKTLVFSAISGFFLLAQASPVTPPPLPVGSNMVQQQAGMNQEEIKRSQRAHHHNKHHKKDVTRDDTLDQTQQDQSGQDQNTGSGGASGTPQVK